MPQDGRQKDVIQYKLFYHKSTDTFLYILEHSSKEKFKQSIFSINYHPYQLFPAFFIKMADNLAAIGLSSINSIIYKLNTFSPREIPLTPLRTTSMIEASPTANKNASNLSLAPVIWMV